MLRSTWSRWLVLGNALLALTAAGCTGGGGTGDGKSTPTPSQTSQVPVAGVTAPDGGKLRVAEQGLSQIKDSYGKAMVSFGVILESTSTNWVANETKLTVTFTDGSGAPVEDTVEHGQYSVYATFPQHRTGLGAQVYVGAPGATRVQVQIGSSTWVPRADPRLAEITAANVQTQRKTGSATFSFALTSAYQRTVTGRYVNIIFRKQGGGLIGGAGLALTRPCDSVPPGKSTCSTGTNYPLPAGTVDSATEVYLNGN
jgi:hypothetical protein